MADIGDDGAHGTVTPRGGDLLGCGHVGKRRGTGLAGTLRAIGRCADISRRRGLPHRAADQFGFAPVGQPQASGDAREEQRDVSCAEMQRDGEDGYGAAALLQCAGEVRAVVDEFAEEAEQACGVDGAGAGAGAGCRGGWGARRWLTRRA